MLSVKKLMLNHRSKLSVNVNSFTIRLYGNKQDDRIYEGIVLKIFAPTFIILFKGEFPKFYPKCDM